LASRRRRAQAEAGRDAFHIRAGENRLTPKPYAAASLALVAAQERAMRAFDQPAVLTVERETIFGPTVELFKVVRDEDGVILTYRIAEDD